MADHGKTRQAGDEAACGRAKCRVVIRDKDGDVVHAQAQHAGFQSLDSQLPWYKTQQEMLSGPPLVGLGENLSCPGPRRVRRLRANLRLCQRGNLQGRKIAEEIFIFIIDLDDIVKAAFRYLHRPNLSSRHSGPGRVRQIR